MKNLYLITAAACGSVSRKIQLRLFVAVICSLLLTSIQTVQAQNCATTGNHTQNLNENTYFPGGTASVSAGATSITVGAVPAGYGATPIAAGDIILIIQMQGAKINLPASITSTLYGGNLTGKSSGFLSTNLSAGTMEFAVAGNSVPLTGGSLSFASGLTYSYVSSVYTTGSDGQYTYQIIRVPSYFNIQLSGTVTTPQWNGSVGGVIVISAVSQLDLNGSTITALGAGFRGGAGIKKTGATGTLLDNYTLSSNNANGSKGEGIAGTPRYVNYNFTLKDNVVEGYPGGSFARGAPGNAGGGATDSNPPSNNENAGGGGGGNGGAGGLGGNGWQISGISGGYGGWSYKTSSPVVDTFSRPSMLIMGGGGGAGDTNDATGSLGALSSSGASGGGIVIINANTIIGSGTVNASGSTFDYAVKNDGSGGGGAGGSILVYANSGNSGITAIANGGVGVPNYPDSASATQHGPGGGGGGGVIYSNLALNIASSVTGGLAGTSYGKTITNSFGAANGTAGLLTSTFPFSQLPPNMQLCQTVVLPVTLINFSASYIAANDVKVAWTTTNEINVDYFEVERSTDQSSFIGIGQVNASQSLNPIHSYNLHDALTNVNSNVVYYRLRIVDINGNVSYSKIIPVKLDQPESNLSVYPNPVDSYVILNLFSDKSGTGLLRLMDNSGRQVFTKSFTVTNGNNSILIDQLGFLPKGVYFIQLMINNELFNQKIVKK